MLILHIGFTLPTGMLSIMYMYWKQFFTKHFYAIKYYIYDADVAFKNFIDYFRNVGGIRAIVASINFQEEIFILEHSGKALSNRTSNFEPPVLVRWQYAGKEIQIHDYENGILNLLALTLTFDSYFRDHKYN